MSRLSVHAVSVLLGTAVALSSVAVHRFVVRGLPLGLLLGAATTVLLIAVLRRLSSRSVASYAVGWVGVFGVAVSGRDEGDYAVAGDLPGYALMALAFLLVVAGISSLLARDSGSDRPAA